MGKAAWRDLLTVDDLNGFFGLVIDNIAVTSFLASALIGIYGYPAEFVFLRMVPGTALGVLAGNLAYSWMAWQLARRSGRSNVTAMPLGIDTPTTIGLALLVLGPSFQSYKASGMDADTAALATWHFGMAAMMVMGLLKFALAFAGPGIGRIVPRAGLLGSIAGIALMLIGFIPIIEIMRLPIVGFAGLGVVLYSVVARNRMPGNMPGAVAALCVGAILYYGLGILGLGGSFYHVPDSFALRLALPVPNLGFLAGMSLLIPYLPLILPFGLLMVIGGVNVAESARAAGDDYNTRDIILTEAMATLLAGLCGGVAQTTPYIGQPAYKRMGARLGYTLLTGLFVGIGGSLGYLAILIEWLPFPVLAPILIFISIEITTQAFQASPVRHAPAVVFSFFPPIARLLAIKLTDPAYVSPEKFSQALSADGGGLPELGVIIVLGNGFIITSMLWAAFLVALTDRRPKTAVASLVLGAGLTAFGIIHSVDPAGGLYWPWSLTGLQWLMMSQFTLAYLVLAVIIGLLEAVSLWRNYKAKA